MMVTYAKSGVPE